MIWVEHVAHVGRYEKCIQNFGLTNLKGEDHFGDLGAHGRVILKMIF
jgi:hypothetical protein